MGYGAAVRIERITIAGQEFRDVEAVCDMPKPVTLTAVKANEKLAQMSLVTSMRLSVQPVTPAEWTEVCRMANLDPKSLDPKKLEARGKKK